MLRNPIVGFLCRFALIYGVLILPIPQWNGWYAQYFRALGETAFSRETGQRIVKFEAHRDPKGLSPLDSRMILSNRDLPEQDGHRYSSMIDLDTRSIGWIPTALTIALILATPVPWARRGWALVWGLALVNVFILFTLQSFIWDESPAVQLTTLSPFWQRVADELEYTLIVQLGASFSVPVLIWILVTFRLEDAKRLNLN